VLAHAPLIRWSLCTQEPDLRAAQDSRLRVRRTDPKRHRPLGPALLGRRKCGGVLIGRIDQIDLVGCLLEVGRLTEPDLQNPVF